MKKSVFLFLLLCLMLIHADYSAEGARYGLLLWYSSVVPALFPFMVLSGLIVSGGGVRVLMAPVSRVLHPLFGLSAEGCYALVSGLLCGCPMGAKTAADFLRDKKISLGEARFLLAAANHPSPMFLLGYVYPLFADQCPLWKVLLSVYGPVAVIGAAAKALYRPGSETKALCPLGTGTTALCQTGTETTALCQTGTETTALCQTGTGTTALCQTGTETTALCQTGTGTNSLCQSGAGANSLCQPGRQSESAVLEEENAESAETADETILAAVEILCKIGGYLVLFSIIIVFLRHTPILPVSFRLALIAAMEITTGIREVASSLPFPLSGACALAALTFGGFSGIFQTKAVIEAGPSKTDKEVSERGFGVGKPLSESRFKETVSDTKKRAGLSIRPYLFWKLFHGAMTAALFLFLQS